MRAHRHRKTIDSYRDYQFRQADKALKRWASFNSIIPSSNLRCTLSELVVLGLHIPSGFASESSYYPDVMHTQRVWAFMPHTAQMVVYLHYCYGGSKQHKASLLEMSRSNFDHWLKKGMRFFVKHNDVDFNKIFA